MRILAFDTCTVTASVAVVSGSETLAEISAGVEARHGESLLPRIGSALERARLTFAAIDLVAVGIGPGSFAGVRVGLATAKGLALAGGKPLRGVVTLRTLARGAPGSHELVAPVLDAYKGEVYAALYARENPSGELRELLAPLHATPEAAAARLLSAVGQAPLLLCGDGARKYFSLLSSGLGERAQLADRLFDLPRASHLAQEARLAFVSKGADDLASLEPLYLRPGDATLPARPLRLEHIS